MQQYNSNMLTKSMTTTAQQTRTKTVPLPPLHNALVDVINAARLERGNPRPLGYIKLEHISGVDHVSIQRTLTRRAKKLSVENMLRIIDALGYHIEIRVSERELSNEEHEYFAAYGAGSTRYQPRQATRSNQEPVFSVRFCPTPSRTGAGSEEIEHASSSRTEHEDHSAVA